MTTPSYGGYMPDVERIRDESIELPSAYQTWLEYWETVQNQQAIQCCNSRCLEKAELGCFVRTKMTHETFVTALCPLCVIDTNKKVHVTKRLLVKKPYTQ